MNKLRILFITLIYSQISYAQYSSLNINLVPRKEDAATIFQNYIQPITTTKAGPIIPFYKNVLHVSFQEIIPNSGSISQKEAADLVKQFSHYNQKTHKKSTIHTIFKDYGVVSDNKIFTSKQLKKMNPNNQAFKSQTPSWLVLSQSTRKYKKLRNTLKNKIPQFTQNKLTVKDMVHDMHLSLIKGQPVLGSQAILDYIKQNKKINNFKENKVIFDRITITGRNANGKIDVLGEIPILKRSK